MKKFFKDFGDFIKRGNVLDLAVGLIIGTSFNAIVKSLVNDIIMPLLGLAGGKNVSDAKWVLVDAVMDGATVVTPAVTLNYGAFIQTIIDFLLIALSIFVAVKIITGVRDRIEKRAKILHELILQKEKKDAEEAALAKAEEPVEEAVVVEAKPTTEDLLVEIRDLLKKEKE